MKRRPVGRAAWHFLYIVLFLATLTAVNAQPVEHKELPIRDVDTLMLPCTGLLAPPEGNESLYAPEARESCAGEVAKLTTSIVDRVREYLNSVWNARAIGMVIGGLAVGFLLFIAVIVAERRRAVGSGALAMIRTAGAIAAFGVAAGYAYFVQTGAAPSFVAADHDLRSMYRLGVVPRGGTANAHAAVQLELLINNTEMKAAEIVANYPGLYKAFPPLTIVAGTELTRIELAERVKDMVAAVEGSTLDQKIAPRKDWQVFVTNGNFLRAQREWDRFGFLARWWLPATIAVWLTLAFHWALLWVRQLIAKRRVEREIRGLRPQTQS